MEASDLNVTKAEQFATYRQTITPEGQETVPDVLVSLHKIISAAKLGGKMIVNYNQGGVTNVTTEQIARVKEGSEADLLLEEQFARK